MSSFVILTIIIVVVIALLGAITQNKKGTKTYDTVKAKRVITLNEQPLFSRLREALPQHIVLAQVAFSALITSKGYASRSRFNRKVADFVVLDKAYNVVAIVELDDSSHRGREQKDAGRDTLLQEAGYTVMRYKRTPDLDKLKADFAAILPASPLPLPVPSTQTQPADPRLPAAVLAPSTTGQDTGPVMHQPNRPG